MFDDMYKAVNGISSMSKESLAKFMKQYGIDEKRLDYLSEHIRMFLSGNNDSSKKLFINSLNESDTNDMFLKYFNSSKMSRCHSLSYDTVYMMKNSLYIEGLEDMYLSLSNKIDTFREEVLMGFITGTLNESFNNEIKDIIGRDVSVIYGSSN